MSLPACLLPVMDAVRYSKLLRQAVGFRWYLQGCAAKSATQRIRCHTKALALLEGGPGHRRAAHSLGQQPGFHTLAPWEEVVRSAPRYASMLRDKSEINRSVILKAPAAGGEKGLLFMTFEYNWVRMLLGLAETERRWLEDHYQLVLSTSWSPTDYAALGMAVAATKGRLLVQSSNYHEIRAIEAFHPRLTCLKTLPCDWTNPDFHQPKPSAARETDILMVANWGAFKRHWEFFRALRYMPPELKIVLIGQPEPGRSRESILALSRTLGVPQRLEMHESLPIEEVAAHQCNSKVSVILSRREGGCLAAVESLFAGCALALRAGAHVGSLAYINEQTGRRLRPGRIHQDLMELMDASSRMSPRQWAMENITCGLSSKKLNTLLKEEAVKSGTPWTQDIAEMQCRPHPTHAFPADRERLRPAYEDLHQRFPKVFGASLIDTSWR